MDQRTAQADKAKMDQRTTRTDQTKWENQRKRLVKEIEEEGMEKEMRLEEVDWSKMSNTTRGLVERIKHLERKYGQVDAEVHPVTRRELEEYFGTNVEIDEVSKMTFVKFDESSATEWRPDFWVRMPNLEAWPRRRNGEPWDYLEPYRDISSVVSPVIWTLVGWAGCAMNVRFWFGKWRLLERGWCFIITPAEESEQMLIVNDWDTRLQEFVLELGEREVEEWPHVEKAWMYNHDAFREKISLWMVVDFFPRTLEWRKRYADDERVTLKREPEIWRKYREEKPFYIQKMMSMIQVYAYEWEKRHGRKLKTMLRLVLETQGSELERMNFRGVYGGENMLGFSDEWIYFNEAGADALKQRLQKFWAKEIQVC